MMPYISKQDQDKFTGLLREIDSQTIGSAGELNFLVTTLMLRYMATRAHRYENLNAAVGAVESAKAEFQRRVVAPYEEEKASECSRDPYTEYLLKWKV